MPNEADAEEAEEAAVVSEVEAGWEVGVYAVRESRVGASWAAL